MPLISNKTSSHFRSLFLTSLAFVLFAGCGVSKQTESALPADPATGVASKAAVGEPSNVSFTTSDGWTIQGMLYSPGKESKSAVILLHQRGGNSSDWSSLSEALAKKGLTVLAIDQRGAGKSTKGRGGVGENAPWDTSGDIEAAVSFLGTKSAIGIAGASYGANNALIYAAAHPQAVKSIALFSPGLDYNGLKTETPAKSWKGSLRIYHDQNDSVAGEGPAQLDKISGSADHKLILTTGSKHGTDLLPEAIKNPSDSVVDFFVNTLK